MRYPLPAAMLLAATLLPGPAAAQADAPQVSHPWARATAPRQTVGAAYLGLMSPTADALVGASTPAADHAELHEMRMDGGVMRMRGVPALPLPAGQAVSLAPGGYHLMLVGLKHPLQAGETFALQLRFQSGRTADVQVVVERPGGPSATPSTQPPAGNHAH